MPPHPQAVARTQPREPQRHPALNNLPQALAAVRYRPVPVRLGLPQGIPAVRQDKSFSGRIGARTPSSPTATATRATAAAARTGTALCLRLTFPSEFVLACHLLQIAPTGAKAIGIWVAAAGTAGTQAEAGTELPAGCHGFGGREPGVPAYIAVTMQACSRFSRVIAVLGVAMAVLIPTPSHSAQSAPTRRSAQTKHRVYSRRRPRVRRPGLLWTDKD